MSPLIVPVDTVRLRIVKLTIRMTPIRANSSMSNSQVLEHFLQFEVPSTLLSPDAHVPQRMPERLKAHWLSEYDRWR